MSCSSTGTYRFPGAGFLNFAIRCVSTFSSKRYRNIIKNNPVLPTTVMGGGLGVSPIGNSSAGVAMEGKNLFTCFQCGALLKFKNNISLFSWIMCVSRI